MELVLRGSSGRRSAISWRLNESSQYKIILKHISSTLSIAAGRLSYMRIEPEMELALLGRLVAFGRKSAISGMFVIIASGRLFNGIIIFIFSVIKRFYSRGGQHVQEGMLFAYGIFPSRM